MAVRVPKFVFDLYEDGLTQGSISLFMRCPEQFRLRIVHGFVPKRGSSDAMEWGSAFHHALEHVFKGMNPGRVPELFNTYITTRAKAFSLTAKEQQSLARIVDVVQQVLPHYLTYWAEGDMNRKFLAKEEAFSVPLKMLDGRVIPIRGRWDGIVASTKKSIRDFETKTKSRIDESGIEGILECDVQTNLYSWAAQQHYKKECSGTIYNVIRRPQLRQGKKESWSDFLNRVHEDVKSRPDFYFMRWECDYSPGDIPLFLRRTLLPVVQKIQHWWDYYRQYPEDPFANPFHHFDPNALMSTYGKVALFELITKGNYRAYTQLSDPYPELVD